jgi:hypothetical protein
MKEQGKASDITSGIGGGRTHNNVIKCGRIWISEKNRFEIKAAKWPRFLLPVDDGSRPSFPAL